MGSQTCACGSSRSEKLTVKDDQVLTSESVKQVVSAKLCGLVEVPDR